MSYVLGDVNRSAESLPINSQAYTYKHALDQLKSILSLDMLKLRVVGYVRDVNRFLSLVIYEINYRKVHMNVFYPFEVLAGPLLRKYFPLTLQ
jgi:hypothetical protein